MYRRIVASAALQAQRTLEQQQRTFQTISNVLKTKHDTAKNTINNLR